MDVSTSDPVSIISPRLKLGLGKDLMRTASNASRNSLSSRNGQGSREDSQKLPSIGTTGGAPRKSMGQLTSTTGLSRQGSGHVSPTPRKSGGQALTLDGPGTPNRKSVGGPGLYTYKNSRFQSSTGATATITTSQQSRALAIPGDEKRPGSTMTSSAAAPALHPVLQDLKWQGESGMRFCVLRGSVVVQEKQISALFSLLTECLAMSEGALTPDVIAAYAVVNRNDRAKAVQVNMAGSVATVLKKSWKPGLDKTITFTDLIKCAYPRAEPEEIEFLANSGQILNLIDYTDIKNIPARPLNDKELLVAVEIFDIMMAGESTKRLSGSRVLELIFHYFPELPANTLRKQLKWVLPSGLYNDLSRDNFRVFLSINQAGSEKARIHMNNLKSALTGQDTVLGRYVRAGEYVTDAEIKEELNSYTKQTLLHKIFSKSKKSLRNLFHR